MYMTAGECFELQDPEEFADDIQSIHHCGDQVEWHMEDAGYDDYVITEQLHRLGYRRVYQWVCELPR